MKKALSFLSLAALSVGLLGSCSKINERIDGVEKRVESIENEKIASIENQIAAINSSIADLGQIRSDISSLKQSAVNHGQDISELQEADETLKNRIDNLEDYLDGDLKKFAEKDWAIATFATLEQLNATKTSLSALEGKVNKLGETFDGKLSDLKTELTNSITSAIAGVNASISTLEARVSALEAMIQSVSITPAYSDGSVEAVDSILTLKCIVSPAEALSGIKSGTLKDSLVLYADSVKVKTKADARAYMEIKVSEATVTDTKQGAITLTANISGCLPKGEDKALTVALHIKNGISHFTTEFVPVESHFTYAEIAGVKWALENLAVSESGKREFKNTGHVIGDYFQWATYAGYCGEASGSDKGLLIYTSFTSKLCGDTENAFSFKDASYLFSIPDWGEGIAPYCTEDEGYTKYTGDAVSTLESIDDAATIILGEEWRMPTIEEYQSLYNATYWAWDATDCGYYVFLPSDAPGKSAGTYGEITGLNKSKAKLFFPASGYVDYTSISETPCAQYLSSSYEPYEFMPRYLSKKFKFDMMSTPPAIDLDLNGMQDRRACGASIRPVKAATAE